MKTPVLLLSIAVAAALSGCNRADNAADGAATTTPPPAADGTPADTAAGTATDTTADTAMDPTASTADQGDSVALGLLAAVNQHEIAAAQQAKGKELSAPVKAYADKMEREHGANLEKTRSLGTPGDNAEVQAQRTKSEQELATLGAKTGDAYEAAYVEAMVKDHTDALALIDTRLMTMASSAPVTAHLTETRQHVAQHLEEARALQTKR